jgi:hypothetical protein
MRKVCYAINGLAFPIKLEQSGIDRFYVTYGMQVKGPLAYAAAASELGANIMHALACEGRLDNREIGEK